ncbi:MAG: aminotransferase class V-fold PLP-dependent enzyme [Clostridia bacterium]|nr:aminotransferase class V-fold PLP-dependent enzyme [Clostridia bacterium]
MIYLDNAATTFPKPHRVTAEVMRCLTEYCGNPGRGSHRLALAAAEQIFSCREALSSFLGVGAPERILFTQNTTYALNLAIKGFLRQGDHVLISELEHNAVRRPICVLAAKGQITFDVFPVVGLTQDELLLRLAEKITPATRAVICTHASNICSITLPIARIGALCRKRGIRLIVDAAQSAGILPIDMKTMHIDALAAPGHKSLYGIQGCGFLAIGKDFALEPLMEGGSGVDSLPAEMPTDPPERFEAGTLPTPAIVGLLEGVRSLTSGTARDLAARERELFCAATERLSSLPDIHIFAKEHTGSVLLFQKDGVSAAELGRHLGSKGICVRTGLHCAPMAHKALGTPDGGAVRVSFGRYNTPSDVDSLWEALKS